MDREDFHTFVKAEPTDERMSDSEDQDISDESGPKGGVRKQSHIFAEQKRRDAIKRGYDNLQAAVPGNEKMGKAQILQKAIEYTQFLLNQKQKQDEELEALEKEMKALQIMKENYEQLVKTTSQSEVQEKNEITEEEKLTVFLKVSDTLWESFKDVVSASTFQVLSSSIFGWLEKYCKPNILKDTVVNAMRSTFSDV